MWHFEILKVKRKNTEGKIESMCKLFDGIDKPVFIRTHRYAQMQEKNVVTLKVIGPQYYPAEY